MVVSVEVSATPSQADAIDIVKKYTQPFPDPKALNLIPVASEDELIKVEELRAAAIKVLGVEPVDDKDFRAIFAQESLLRFLRARSTVKEPLAASTNMLLASLNWRREYDLDGNLRDWYADESEEAEYLRKTWPCGCHGIDRRGVPVYYARYGRADMAEACETAGFERFLRFSLSQSYEGWVGCDNASVVAGQHLVTMICVADMGGLSWRRAMRAVPHFKQLSRVLDDNFPEKLHVAYVINAPRIFSMVFKMVAPFLAADTKAKVRVFGKGDDHLRGKGGMLELVDEDQIPKWLGGTSAECAIPVPCAKGDAAEID